MGLLRSLLTEYGLKWTTYRSLYALRLKLFRLFPPAGRLFEHRTVVRRTDLFSFDIPAIQDFLKNLPANLQQDLLTTADRAIDGVLTGFSSLPLNFGQPIDWHLNPLTGQRSPSDQKWYRIPDFDPVRGDIKVIWEASRLTQLLHFARASLLTSDPKYHAAFSRQLQEWLAANPYPYGANFKCGQEATLRMVNVLISSAVFDAQGLLTDADRAAVKALAETSIRKVRANFFYAHKCIRNNHTFTEILGLIIGVWCCEEPQALRRAYQLMDQEIRLQFRPDGGYTQYSFNYQRFTLHILACLLRISDRTGHQIRETGRIANSVQLLHQLQDETGDLPNYGSNDGALIFPLSACAYRDFRPVLGTLHAWLTGQRLFEAGPHDEELLWLGPPPSSLKPAPHQPRTSQAWPDSGYWSFRHSGGFLMTCLQDYRVDRPSHMDQLHLDLWQDGVNVLCDSGTYSYASAEGRALATTAAHNTVVLPGIDQMNKRGAFLVIDWPQRDRLDAGPGHFTGRLLSHNGYRHQREILQTDTGYRVVDEVTLTGATPAEPCFDQMFHTPCTVTLESNGFSLSWAGKTLVRVRTSGTVTVRPAQRSLHYLQLEPIQLVAVRHPLAAPGGTARAEFSLELGYNRLISPKEGHP
jgi:hypothetical protein